MKVLKFGGTSVGKPDRMHSVAKLISSTPDIKVVVLSAVSGTTNALVDISNKLTKKDTKAAEEAIANLFGPYKAFVEELYSTAEGKSKGHAIVKTYHDLIKSYVGAANFGDKETRLFLAQGEIISTNLFQEYLSEQGYSSALLPALEFMKTDADNEPMLDYIETKLNEQLAKHPNKSLYITQGYVCLNSDNEVDNLKRGGSDYTATLVGAALQMDEIQIWTDIDGMHNNDPRIVSKTHPIHELSFDEAAELAYFGAKILHPTCILPAQKRNIPVLLKNTMQPDALGTVISNINTSEGIKAVAAKDNICAINIKSDRMLLAHGFLRAVFEIFERYKTSIDMITTSEIAVSLTIDNTLHLKEIKKELEEFANVEVEDEQTIICIVGNLPREKAGYGFKILESLKDIPLRMVSYGGSSNNVSVLVNSKHKKEALVALNKGLFGY